MTKSIYNLRSTEEDTSFVITKFDRDLNPESSYIVSLASCECPQFTGRGKTCRHQKMLPMFLALDRQDTEYFLDFDTKTWHRPLATSYEIEYHDLLLSRLKAQAKAEHDKEQPTPAGVKVIPNSSQAPNRAAIPANGLDAGQHGGTTDAMLAPFTARADTATLPSAASVSPAAPTEPEVPCVSVGAAPIKRRRI